MKIKRFTHVFLSRIPPTCFSLYRTPSSGRVLRTTRHDRSPSTEDGLLYRLKHVGGIRLKKTSRSRRQSHVNGGFSVLALCHEKGLGVSKQRDQLLLIYALSVSREHPHSQWVDVRYTKYLKECGWKKSRKNVLIIHGFNGTHSKTPMSFIRDAYLSRGDYNVFMVDWSPLTRFPCYLSSLSNMRLTSQCTAQLYSHITQAGALAKSITCVGHSLGAHICGMITNHLTEKQYKIVGLDPARPLIHSYGSREFRLSPNDAKVVHVLHTNAGFLGETGQVGHADFCINGGRLQPGCKGHFMRVNRCSHFKSSCYFAASVRKRLRIVGVPCTSKCPKDGARWGIRFDQRAVKVGEDTPDSSRGMYCVSVDHVEDCPFD